jgi:Bifunctional DNA primase/polymerase, N-terminal
MNDAEKSNAERSSSYGERPDLFWIDTDEEYFNDLIERNWPTLCRWHAIAAEAPRGTIVHIQVRDNVETVTFIPPLVEHAIGYASLGWHVFPLRLRDKVSHKSAEHSDGRRWGQTIDADEIRHDFRQWPDANIGIVTGEASGFFVVETDTADGHGEGVDGAAELAKLEAEHETLPATREAISPSGSVHRYFKHPGFKIKNSASLIGPGIDVRGDGGMVVGPPSVKLGKGVYSWRNDLPIADAPPWLLDRIVAGKMQAEPELSISQRAAAFVVDPHAVYGGETSHGNDYIEAAVRGEYDEVARASKGKRNSQLNTSSLKLGHYVGGGILDEKIVVDQMMAACEVNALLADDGREKCLATIDSGMLAGKAQPKGIPERNVIQFPIGDGLRGGNTGSPADQLPEIQVKDGELSLLATSAEEMLIDAGTPLYQRGGVLVRPIIETVDASRGRKTKVAQLKVLDSVYARDLMGRHAHWMKWDGRAKKLVRTNPPMEIASVMLARAGDWTFPTIAGVISTPTMRPDGSLLTEAGYDESTRLLLVEPPPLPPIPDRPTRDDALAALRLLEGLLAGFPFVDDIAIACALSAIITPVVRGAFAVAPLHASRAPTAGSGKSFLWDTVAAISIGQPMPVMSTGPDQTEMEKRLGTAMMTGQPLISIDNISTELGGDALCQIIERPVVEIRILGRSERVRIEARGTTLFATGNNFVILADVVRRVIITNLDPEMERPELRQFKFDPVEMILTDRGKYIAAALTICRAYIVAGRPDCAPRLASFEGWSDTVRSSLIWLGKADPVQSMENARAEDPERLELSAMMEGWCAAIGFGIVARVRLASALSAGAEVHREYDGADLVPAHPEFHATLQAMALRETGKRGQMPDTTTLGNYLRRFKGRVIAGKRFANLPDEKKGAEWWVEEVRAKSEAD